MDQVILGGNSFLKNFFLSNYSLTYQILIINLLTAIIGLFFLFVLNFFIITNDKSIENQTEDLNKKLNQVGNYLAESAIVRVQLFNEECEKKLDEKLISAESKDLNICKKIVLSDPQLDPTITQKYLFQNFMNINFDIEIFDDSWIKYADTKEMYVSSDVVELDINNNENVNQRMNYYNLYRNYYISFFNSINNFFIKRKFQSFLINYNSNIFIVQQTIKEKKNLSNIYLDKEKNIIQILSKPVVKDDTVYGVIIFKSLLNKENVQIGIISFNLVNLYFIIIVIMFLSSVFFSRSIVAPIKLLSRITRSERDKSSKQIKKYIYPNRKDEIGILGEDIKSMSIDLKKRINDIESFAADVSHELKNPISSLKTSNELITKNVISEDKKTLLTKNMNKDIERMNILISDISSYTLTQLEIEEEIFQDFNLIIFIKEFLKSYSNNKKKIKINFEFEDSKLNIFANQNKLAQVFYNILDNSISYSSIESSILIKQSIRDNFIIIHIVDQGPGIPLNLSNKIFQRFYSDRAKDRDQHSGLGLSIAMKIVESFQGSLSLIKNNYQSYQGACFEINLPLKEKTKNL